MSPRTLELLDLVARWIHVVAGTMWIGNSLLFNWLDRILQPSRHGSDGRQGETWLLHSGGFYHLEKTLLEGQPLPRPLHWFKWQAYTTWLSGAALLVIVYYVGGRALMVGGARPGLAPGTAVGIGAGAVVASWIVYDLLWRYVFHRSHAIAASMSVVALLALTWSLTHLLSGRAAFLHVGAALGTIMAGNVAMSIMPSQRALVAGVGRGQGADPVIADQAKTRSMHNNYLTFPVIALMLSSHFPSLYGSRFSWLMLLVIIASGAAVRHVLNIRFTSRRWVPALGGTIALSVTALYVLVHAGGPAILPATPAAQVTFDQVRSIIDRRCTSCHSQRPSDVTFGPAPGGVSFDDVAMIQALAGRIRERAYVTRTMPPANSTRITDEERALLARWAESSR